MAASAGSARTSSPTCSPWNAGRGLPPTSSWTSLRTDARSRGRTQKAEAGPGTEGAEAGTWDPGPADRRSTASRWAGPGVAAGRKTVKLLGWFQLVVGAAMIVLWTALLVTGQVPELAAGQRDILFHLLAELLAATALLVAGAAVLRRHRRATMLSAFALGALLYTAVNSSGYYADSGDWAAVGMFGVLALVALALFLRVLGRATPDPTATGTAVPARRG